jgi:integrase
VTPHYFRHFFTTHLRDRTGDRGIVKYLRGDVVEDVIDTYTHLGQPRAEGVGAKYLLVAVTAMVSDMVFS